MSKVTKVLKVYEVIKVTRLILSENLIDEQIAENIKIFREVSVCEFVRDWNSICCGLISWRNRSLLSNVNQFWYFTGLIDAARIALFTANWKFLSADTLAASSCCLSVTCGDCAMHWKYPSLCLWPVVEFSAAYESLSSKPAKPNRLTRRNTELGSLNLQVTASTRTRLVWN